MITLLPGDCLTSLEMMPSGSVDSVVTDPPYHLTSIVRRFGAEGAAPAQFGTDGAYARASRGFMGKTWDGGDIAFRVELWAEVWRVLKPGGYVVAFSGTRTQHRMVVAIEDAGFEIRDQLAWVYGSGFPKSLDIAKAIDKAAGAKGEVTATGAAIARMIPGADQHVNGWTKDNGREYQPGIYAPATDAAKQWEGWGTALKPAWEPICLARKPLIGTNVENVLAHGTGALNIDGCRVEAGDDHKANCARNNVSGIWRQHGSVEGVRTEASALGRWPANILHDGSDEVLAAFPSQAGAASPVKGTETSPASRGVVTGTRERVAGAFHADRGSAARFFYCAKAGTKDRNGSKHPTVKPIALMRWLCRLVTPPGGVVLDPFAGSGTTGQAARDEGFSAILCEREAEYLDDINRRLCLTPPPEDVFA